ncbi:hypothetical protein Sme01_39510 [Sphaerisporangium melleum]|uniref:Uncharacterized protein n=1 Tax=Sphaerisporangium melleum TaxID=321316 RepID=A0A917R3Y7_9ACTN|nr:hypothetical protein GCM10007964_30930 [Sphaerisporangium melleum]GII71475.1 hypothetical protein Sme01_39510 [Sphaerisporangium melleum]
MLSGSVSCGIAPQVLTQCPSIAGVTAALWANVDMAILSGAPIGSKTVPARQVRMIGHAAPPGGAVRRPAVP